MDCVRLVLNSLPREYPDDLTVAALLQLEGEPPSHVVVEVNGVYVPMPEYSTRRLAEGDRVETILPAFGG